LSTNSFDKIEGKRHEMKATRSFAFIFSLGLLLSGALAQSATVTGTVTDKTTNKPAAGDEVVLVEPMSGMSEIAHTTCNAQGRYTLNLPGANPYLIKATHQGAEYFIPAPQGGGAGDISVYDVAAKVAGVTIDEWVSGIETDNGQLRVVERYDIHNESAPPTTQWSKKSFEIVLPADAVIGDVSAQRPGAGTLPTSVKLEPEGPKGHYSFNFPIQPDEGGKGTLFQVQYELPYGNNKYSFHSFVTMPAHTVWVVLPKSMSLTAGSGTNFELSPQDPSVQTYMTRDAVPGKALDYTISGTGAFPREDQGGGQGDNSGSQASGPGNQPGGGIGEPINTPDPLSKYKWWILGALGLLLAAGAAFLLRKPAGAASATAVRDEEPVYSRAAATPVAQATPASHNAALMNVLKEELFAIESEKISGKITAEEYAEQKSALETVLKRALKRNA
jgi:hypothetical protein